MKAGIIGLASVGKSTLFQLLTGAPSAAPSGRPEPRVGVARVPDDRVSALAEIFKPRKKTWATVEYVDVPGVAKGEGSALVDLPALRGVDALVHVVRAFASDTVPHPEGSVDPLRDAKMLELELILADLGAVERRLEKLVANIKKASRPEDVAERALFLRMKEGLEEERPLRELPMSEEERHRLRNYSLLSEKPVLLVVNLGEAQIREASALLDGSGLAAFAARPGFSLCPVSAPIEAEMAQLAPDDARAFREDLGLAEPGLERVIRSSYALLGLISFLTTDDGHGAPAVSEGELEALLDEPGILAPVHQAPAVREQMPHGRDAQLRVPFEPEPVRRLAGLREGLRPPHDTHAHVHLVEVAPVDRRHRRVVSAVPG